MRKENLIIIGASSALGTGFLRAYGSRYANIIAHCHNKPGELKALAIESGLKLNIIACDLSTEAGAANLVAAVETSGLQIDALAFFAAPRLHIQRFYKLKWEDVAHHIDIQTRTAFLLMQNLLPGMARRKQGKLVFVLSSVLDGKPPQGMADYVIGKYALLGLIKSAAAEYAGKHVCINAVSPSMMETPFLDEVPGALIEMNAEVHPRGANATPTEIIPVVCFLLSEEAGFITGQNIITTGGA